MILDAILAHKRHEVELRRSQRPLDSLLAAIDAPPSMSPLSLTRVGDAYPREGETSSYSESRTVSVLPPFASALRQPGLSIIAEFKRRSPSGGDLRPGASAADIARVYATNGAAAMSVLTDEPYFGGSDQDLVDARHASALPALRKDFVVDPYQVYEARAIGADAILLIVRALSDKELRDFLDLSHRRGMDALVETHSEDEVRRALDAGATIVGVNNRDLDTLVTDVSLAPRLRPLVPPSCIFVAESGVSQPAQIAALQEAGADAALIGESLLRAADPGEVLRSLVTAGAPRGARV